MCLAVPGKIVEISGDKAIVDYELEKRSATIIEHEFSVGDFVIVQGGFVVSKVAEKEARSALDLYKQAVSSQARNP